MELGDVDVGMSWRRVIPRSQPQPTTVPHAMPSDHAPTQNPMELRNPLLYP